MELAEVDLRGCKGSSTAKVSQKKKAKNECRRLHRVAAREAQANVRQEEKAVIMDKQLIEEKRRHTTETEAEAH